jgi:predicted phage-related endonuclease
MSYIGGSDARTILGRDEGALTRLWQEKRGEVEPQNLEYNLAVQLGCVTEELNRRWFARETRLAVNGVQRFVRHPKLDWMGATLDGMVEEQGAVFEAKFMLPWSFAEDAAVDKHMAQLQHNMLVTGASRAYLSVLTGGAKWVSMEVEADPVYQTVLVQVERIFWRCVRPGSHLRFSGPSRRSTKSQPSAWPTCRARMPGPSGPRSTAGPGPPTSSMRPQRPSSRH